MSGGFKSAKGLLDLVGQSSEEYEAQMRGNTEPLADALRFGEKQGWFVELVPVTHDGVGYEVPKVFWDDFLAEQKENERLRDLFKCANAEKRKRKRERDRALTMIVGATAAIQKEKRQAAKMKKMHKDAQVMMSYVQHKLGCEKQSSYLKPCTCGAEAAVITARGHGWIKDERKVLSGV